LSRPGSCQKGTSPGCRPLFFASTQILISTTDRRYLNQRGKLAEFLVPNAHTTYIIHALVATTVALIVRDSLLLHPLLKWVVVALVSDPLCFGLSALIRKIPYTDRVL
jgi:surface polysaccharide O-acyltransferase-like enzyme